MFEQLLTAASAVAASPAVEVQDFLRRPTVMAQVDLSAGATATVTVQGRLSETLSWVDLHEFTASGIQVVTACPHMRFNVAAVTGGTVSAVLAG